MAEPYRILYLIESLGFGGAEKRLVNDLRCLDRSRFSSVVCHLYSDQTLRPELEELNIPVYGLGLENVYQGGRALRGLLAIIRRHRIQLVHTQLFGADLYGRLAGCLTRKPVVTTIQSTLYDPLLVSFFSWKRKMTDRLTAPFFTRKFIAVSYYVKKILEEELGIREEKISVIYNSVDVEAFSTPPPYGKQTLLRELKAETEGPLLLHVGRLIPEKGHRYLLSAMQIVLHHFPDAILLLAGEGPERSALETLTASLNLEKSVYFLGNRRDIRDLLHFSDLFLFPSLREGMPVALLEAMAAGKPCIVSKIGSLEELIEEGTTGILIPPRDSQKLAEAICFLLQRPESARKMGGNAVRLIREKCNIGTNVKKLEALYSGELNHAA